MVGLSSYFASGGRTLGNLALENERAAGMQAELLAFLSPDSGKFSAGSAGFWSSIGSLANGRVLDPAIQNFIESAASALDGWPEGKWQQQQQWLKGVMSNVGIISVFSPEAFSHELPAADAIGSALQIVARLNPAESAMTTRDQLRQNFASVLRKVFEVIQSEDAGFWQEHLRPLIEAAEAA